MNYLEVLFFPLFLIGLSSRLQSEYKDDFIIFSFQISDLDSIDITTHGFTRHAIPDAEDVVRIDVVGGFAIQKVADNRSYFRLEVSFSLLPLTLIY